MRRNRKHTSLRLPDVISKRLLRLESYLCMTKVSVVITAINKLYELSGLEALLGETPDIEPTPDPRNSSSNVSRKKDKNI